MRDGRCESDSDCPEGKMVVSGNGEKDQTSSSNIVCQHCYVADVCCVSVRHHEWKMCEKRRWVQRLL